MINNLIGSGASSLYLVYTPKISNPTFHVDIKEKDVKFCKHKIQKKLHVGRRKYQNIINKYCVVNAVKHGAIGKDKVTATINVYKNECEQCIKNLADEHGESHATRFVREEKKIFSYEKELSTIELPSYFTKRRLHRNYCRENGHIATSNATGIYTITPAPDTTQITIVSWGAFRSIWDDRCRNIRIRPPCRDTCDMCYKHKMLLTKKKKI